MIGKKSYIRPWLSELSGFKSYVRNLQEEATNSHKNVGCREITTKYQILHMNVNVLVPQMANGSKLFFFCFISFCSSTLETHAYAHALF